MASLPSAAKRSNSNALLRLPESSPLGQSRPSGLDSLAFSSTGLQEDEFSRKLFSAGERQEKQRKSRRDDPTLTLDHPRRPPKSGTNALLISGHWPKVLLRRLPLSCYSLAVSGPSERRDDSWTSLPVRLPVATSSRPLCSPETKEHL